MPLNLLLSISQSEREILEKEKLTSTRKTRVSILIIARVDLEKVEIEKGRKRSEIRKSLKSACNVEIFPS